MPIPLAFPGCVGFGAHEQGARRGASPKLFRITSATDTPSPGTGALVDATDRIYTGNLRYALEFPSDYIVIIFEVGGTHTLAYQTTGTNYNYKGSIRSLQTGVTVLGDTAPGSGVMIDGVIFMDRPGQIWRHMHHATDDSATYDSTQVLVFSSDTSALTSGLAVTNCTLRWGKDEVFGLNQRVDYTVMDCRIEGGLSNNLGVPGGGRCFQGASGGTNTMPTRGTVYRNILYGGADERHPLMAAHHEVINNLVVHYGTGIMATYGAYYQAMKGNWIKNLFLVTHGSQAAPAVYPPLYGVQNVGFTNSLYAKGNIIEHLRPADSGDEFSIISRNGSPATNPITFSGTKLDIYTGFPNWVLPSEVDALTLLAALTDETTGAGARRTRDSDGLFVEDTHNAVDLLYNTYIQHTPRPYNTNGAAYPYSGSTISNSTDGVGWPSMSTGLPLGTGFDDTNGDGIPDAWTLPAGAKWHTLDVDGYLMIERWVYEDLGFPRYWDDPPGEPYNITLGSPFTVSLNTPTALTGVSVYSEGEDIDDVEFDGGSNVTVRVGALGTVPAGVTLSVPE